MLVLSRKRSEEVVLTTQAGEEIIVEVVEFKQGESGGPFKVRLGFTAPDSVTIDRREVHDIKHPKARETHVSDRPSL